jgi:hypothetical protein
MGTNPNTGEVAEARDFLQVLGDMPNTVTDLTEKWQELADGVRDTGKKGSIQLTISVMPQKGDETIKTITPVVKVSVPQVPLKPVIMFDQPDGTLARQNPAVSLFEMDDTPTRQAPSRDDAPIREAGQR